MDDDLGTPAAVAVMHDLVREGNTALKGSDDATAEKIAGQVWSMLRVLGLDPADFATGGGSDDALAAAMELVMQFRTEARDAKDWARADLIRTTLGDAGIAVEDTPDGPRWSTS
jgi:cysteinyl-tRNA synthetase